MQPHSTGMSDTDGAVSLGRWPPVSTPFTSPLARFMIHSNCSTLGLSIARKAGSAGGRCGARADQVDVVLNAKRFNYHGPLQRTVKKKCCSPKLPFCLRVRIGLLPRSATLCTHSRVLVLPLFPRL